VTRKERTLLIVIAINAALILFKSWLAGASGSLSLRASAAHSIADAAVTVFVLFGLLLARSPIVQNRVKASVTRVESVLALGVAIAIFYVGVDIVRDVLSAEPPELKNVGWVALAAAVTIPVAFFIARYLRYVGKQTNSPALVAAGYHAQMDIYASIVVVAGLAGAALGIPGLDRVAAAIVAVFVLFAGYEIVTSAWHGLTHPDEQAEIGETAGAHMHLENVARPLRAFAPVVALALLGIYVLSGIYVVQPNEAAVVRRFGGVAAPNVGPGLHYRLPWPIEQVDIVDVSGLRRAEVPAALMLTGDENLISVRLSVHYAVKDAAAFLLNISSPESLVQQAADAGMRQVVAQEGVDALLTVDKAVIQQRAAELTQQILDRYGAGLSVASVQLLQSDPPPEVADAFRDVASAREDRNTFINEALAYQNEVLPVARGDAETKRQTAQAYKAEKTAAAQGEATQFASRQGAYAAAPGVTRTRLYLEAVERSLPGKRKFIIDQAVKLQNTDLFILDAQNAQQLPTLPAEPPQPAQPQP
jgi:membrane protease subunit HflK